jgi:hypothetical protein
MGREIEREREREREREKKKGGVIRVRGRVTLECGWKTAGGGRTLT